MRLYLAGPMTGIPQINYPAFDAAAANLREQGFEVRSPAEMDDPKTRAAALASPDGAMGSGVVNGETWGDFLARDVKIVADEVDGVIVLPGWEKSRGARLEVFCARNSNKPVFDYETSRGADLLELDEATLDAALGHVAPPASTEIRITDPNTGGQKGQKVERFDLIPAAAHAELARVYGKGAEKYDDDNWRRGYRWRLSVGALERHLSEWKQNRSIDAETGCHHLMHAAWHCYTLYTFETEGLGTDDLAERR